MSIKIVFESKRRQEENPYFLYPDDPVTKARGILVGSDVIVDDNASMTFLTNNGFYGSYLGQRMNFHNTSCFPKPEQPTEPSELGDIEIRMPNPGVDWLMSLNFGSQRRLYLCAEEVVYLAKRDQLEVDGKTLADLWDFYAQRDGIAFKRRYLVYEHLRNLGWTVRSAVNFSGDFSLYKESPQSCHSSAIAQIAPDAKSINSPAMFAMRRHLKNVKKALLLVTINLDDNQTWESVNYESSVRIETYHTPTPLAAHKLELLC